jgi:hypothetical protein
MIWGILLSRNYHHDYWKRIQTDIFVENENTVFAGSPSSIQTGSQQQAKHYQRTIEFFW